MRQNEDLAVFEIEETTMNVCNSCGSPYEVLKCSTCPTLICFRCRTNHESVCEFNQKKKSLGLGPTVRQVNIVPEKQVVEPVPEEQTNESNSETVLSQEQNSEGAVVNQGGDGSSESAAEHVDSVGGQETGSSDSAGVGSDSPASTVETPVVSVETSPVSEAAVENPLVGELHSDVPVSPVADSE